MMVSFVLSFFPRDVLDEILNLIGSVSEGFPSYSIMNPIFIGFEETFSYWSVDFFLCYSLDTINRQTSYDSDILHQDYRIIRGFIAHHQSANFV